MRCRLVVLGGIVLLVGLSVSCRRERAMAEKVEMPDTMAVVRAMHDAAVMDALLDTMPGGEMARGDSAAAMKLLREKM